MIPLLDPDPGKGTGVGICLPDSRQDGSWCLCGCLTCWDFPVKGAGAEQGKRLMVSPPVYQPSQQPWPLCLEQWSDGAGDTPKLRWVVPQCSWALSSPPSLSPGSKFTEPASCKWHFICWKCESCQERWAPSRLSEIHYQLGISRGWCPVQSLPGA